MNLQKYELVLTAGECSNHNPVRDPGSATYHRILDAARAAKTEPWFPASVEGLFFQRPLKRASSQLHLALCSS
mgnify:CR=1 FL=1